MFEIEYQFNFCDTLPNLCDGLETSAAEFLDIYEETTDTCQALGLASQSRFHLLDDTDANKGLMITYQGGVLCEGTDNPSLTGLPRKTIFTLECGAFQDKQV